MKKMYNWTYWYFNNDWNSRLFRKEIWIVFFSFYVSWFIFFSFISCNSSGLQGCSWFALYFELRRSFWHPSCRLGAEAVVNLSWEENAPACCWFVFCFYEQTVFQSGTWLCMCCFAECAFCIARARKKKKRKIPKERSWYFLLLTL